LPRKKKQDAQKRVVFVAHCVLNQNAKVAVFARYPGVVSPIVDLARQKGYAIEQLPCPELLAMGITRWWTTKDIYDNPGYRRHCAGLAKWTADVVERYAKNGYDVRLIGLDGSPSSGVRFTGTSEPTWGGRPNATVEQFKIVPGKGVWIEELEKELKRRGLAFPKATGVPMDDPTFSMEKSVREIEQFLEE
jgi:predicted secreted protein